MKTQHVLLVAVGVGAFIFFYHQYEKSVANAQKAYMTSVTTTGAKTTTGVVMTCGSMTTTGGIMTSGAITTTGA